MFLYTFVIQPKMPIRLDPEIWGPHYWFFLHTLAYSYPSYPNETTKRKYYDLVQNLPLFIPNDGIGNKFSRLLDRYPVTPYLDKRESFLRWVNFIHNKINYLHGKDEMTLEESIRAYEQQYSPKPFELFSGSSYQKNAMYTNIATATVVCMFVYWAYNSD